MPWRVSPEHGKNMTFSSATFLFAFLPLFMGVYFLLRGRGARNLWLFVASVFFYAWGEPVYVVLMLCSILANWFFALRIADACGARSKKRRLFAACVFNVLVIGFFKYESFVAGIVNSLLGANVVPDLRLPLPIGISFYTLQALSYVIDVYRGQAAPQRNLLDLGMYIACFPQLIAGPIVRYQTIEEGILHRKENLDDFASGLRLFLVGLAKKILLADTVAILAEAMLARGGADIGLVGAWGGLLAYTFQIYFDFSGYSDMAIGMGRMVGFRYLPNFNYPYISTSITEFWRRWHLTLASFFRDYLYIPLGGNRVGKARWVFNIVFVWAVTGLWHGAAWNFVLWGLYQGALLLLEKLVYGQWLEKQVRVLRHAYAVLAFMFGFLIFWMDDPGKFRGYLLALFGGYGWTGASTFWELQVWSYVPMFVLCAVAATPILPRFREALRNRGRGCGECFAWCGDAALVALLVLCVCSVAASRFSPFIYCRF